MLHEFFSTDEMQTGIALVYRLSAIQLVFCKNVNKYPCDLNRANVPYRAYTTVYIGQEAFSKEYKLKREGRMLVFVICGFIKNVLPNSYFILQIYRVKSFKMMHVISM